MTEITYSDFEKVEIRVGKVLEVADFPEAKKPAYKLWIDFGALGVKKSSAQITKYCHEELIGKQVLAVTNFPARQVANFMSEVLVLGVVLDDGQVVLIQPDRNVPLGDRVL
ncbi:tRNA-binding protein [Gloeocapsopsis crepidinum LEGE 06123]|uniref:tRNA-binding protein n=1 Tax=Gloeocapsopsis crepidinum LEGE 06123 TaxID=588587 RepID=A0ABR9UVU0_9CHRO|nr:tRNA-binding protein [Gloeocapsopsis crepidinum]MBE9192421.1 tRNA-binding protein [Gloeocapsopsis crepidinum LEGE 06123]